MMRYLLPAAPRPLAGRMRRLAHTLAGLVAALYLAAAGYGLVPPETHRALFLGSTLVLIFLWYPAGAASPRHRPSATDGLLAGLAAAVTVYFVLEYPAFVRRAGAATPADVWLGGVAIGLSLEATRRVIGPVVPLVAVAALLYAWNGVAPLLPSALAHRGFGMGRIVAYLYATVEGLFGVVTYTFATHVFLFVILGAFLERSGVGRFFVDLPHALLGRSPGGSGKVAVAASALIGSVTGSPTANTVATGTFTIPLMKRTGYAPHTAAAIETAASTGGQFLPPVMGAAAFLMVELTGIPYVEVVKLAAVPALVYFAGVMAMVHFHAAREGLRGVDAAELPDWRRVIRHDWHLAAPLVVVLVQLLRGYSPGLAAAWGILTAVVVSWRRAETRMGPGAVARALVDGTGKMLPIASVAGSVGIIVGVIALTGVGLRFSSIMLSMSGDSLLLAMAIVALTALVLGVGLPITATYAMLATLVPPALASLGVTLEASHLTLIWYSQLSGLTPPVCLVAYAAAAIAGADPFRTGLHSMKFGAFLFPMPLLFVYTPLLLGSTALMNVLAVVTAVVAAVTTAAILQGYLVCRTTWLERILLAGGTVALFTTMPIANAAGLGLAGLVYVRQRMRRPGPAVQSGE